MTGPFIVGKKRGHDPVTGRFAKGNPGGPGRPKFSSKAAKLREAFYRATKPDDIVLAVRKLREAVARGEPWAIKETFDRNLGRPEPVDFIERLEQLEAGRDQDEQAEIL